MVSAFYKNADVPKSHVLYTRWSLVHTIKDLAPAHAIELLYFLYHEVKDFRTIFKTGADGKPLLSESTLETVKDTTFKIFGFLLKFGDELIELANK
jgi:hypothetical protein